MSRKELSFAVNTSGGQIAPVCFTKGKETNALWFQLKLKGGNGNKCYGSYEQVAEMYTPKAVAGALKLLKDAKGKFDQGTRFGENSKENPLGVGEYLPTKVDVAKPEVPAVAGEAKMTTDEISKLVAKGVPADVVAAMVNLRGFAG